MSAEESVVITTEVVSDLIKIGIPSLIALIGAFVSYRLAIKGQEKDLLIENIRNRNEGAKERGKREGELIQQISVELSAMQRAFLLYATMLGAKIETESLQEEFPEKYRKELSLLFQDLIGQLHEAVTLDAHVSLLGNIEIIDKYHDYLSHLNDVPRFFVPGDTSITQEQLNGKIENLSEEYRNILNKLSKVFLLEE